MSPHPHPVHRHRHPGRVLASRATPLLQGQVPPIHPQPTHFTPCKPTSPVSRQAHIHTQHVRRLLPLHNLDVSGASWDVGHQRVTWGGTVVSGRSAATGASQVERQPWMAATTLLPSWWARDSVSGQPRPHPRAAPRPPRGACTALREQPVWLESWPAALAWPEQYRIPRHFPIEAMGAAPEYLPCSSRGTPQATGVIDRPESDVLSPAPPLSSRWPWASPWSLGPPCSHPNTGMTVPTLSGGGDSG